jgi:putative DNA primase/helicase
MARKKKTVGDVQGMAETQRSKKQQGAGLRIIPPPSDPMSVARVFLKESGLSTDGLETIRYWRGGWWFWRTSHWQESGERMLRSMLYRYTEIAAYMTGDGPLLWQPNRKKVSDLADALTAIAILPAETDAPTWLDGRANGTIVAVQNGLLDIEHKQLLPHSPSYFNMVSVPFDYDADAPEPKRWLEFLEALWPDDPAAIDALAEWAGYVISGRLDLHKILLMVGPTRGGKGVIARVLSALVGDRNVAGPTLSSLGGEFGLAPLLGKTLAVISDARFVGKNGHTVVERLLSISGEDSLTVNRKYRDQWTGKLPCRLHIVSNELPRLGDASQAIIGRIVLLMLTRSWLGKEDHGLEVALRGELTGILNWALDGLRRLTENENAFTRTAGADEAVAQMRDLASPVAAFVRENCEVGKPEYEVAKDELYLRFKEWCEATTNQKLAKHVFGRDLRAAYPSIKQERPRDDDDPNRPRNYIGIRLRK